jgi:hypothetical protein
MGVLIFLAVVGLLVWAFLGIFVFTPVRLEEWWSNREPVRYRRAERQITAAVDNAIAELRKEAKRVGA